MHDDRSHEVTTVARRADVLDASIEEMRDASMFDVRTENLFDFRSPEYVEVFQRSPATAFQHPLWLSNFYAHLGLHAGVKPLIVVVRHRPSGRPALVLPLIRRPYSVLRAIEFADLGVSDYASPICTKEDFDSILADAVTCEKIQQQLKPFDVLRILKLREMEPPLEDLLGDARRAVMEMSSHAVALYAPYSQWRAENVGASLRKELDKKARQLRQKGQVEFKCANDPALIDTTLRSIREYRRIRLKGDVLQQDAYFPFYQAISADTVFSRAYCLLVDQKPIAGVFGLSHAGSFVVILSGFDLATYKNYSVGKLLFEEVARDCIERGDQMLDFTIGDEAYKGSFGAQPSGLFIIYAAGSWRGSIAGMVEQRPWLKNVGKRFVGLLPPGKR